MKIKEVCELTGLTDRTVRFYVEERLIDPNFTENYLGRKSFSFSEDDVLRLKDIAVLRKFGYSVSEIREMILNPKAIPAITDDLKQRKKGALEQEKMLSESLQKADVESVADVSKLAEQLSRFASTENIVVEEHRSVWSKIKSFFKKALIFSVILAPFFCATIIQMLREFSGHYSFPVFRTEFVLLLLVSFAPSVLYLCLPRFKLISKKRLLAKRILLVLCAISVPFSIAFSGKIESPYSETTDFSNYRDFDAACIANRSERFQELFPKWPHYFENIETSDGNWETVYLDACYYYKYSIGWDYTYDIFAEWPLKEEDFWKEVERAELWFEKYSSNTHKNAIVKKGNYTCFILYDSWNSEPFQAEKESYTYFIFAYDKQNLRVRYICCDSLNDGVEQPYYLTLDW